MTPRDARLVAALCAGLLGLAASGARAQDAGRGDGASGAVPFGDVALRDDAGARSDAGRRPTRGRATTRPQRRSARSRCPRRTARTSR